MAETTTITIRVEAETKQKLDRLAELTQRSRSWLAADALDRYLAEELEICEGIVEAMKDADAGNTIPHEEAMAIIEAAVERAARKSA